jgi:hypothetical protein
VPWSWRWLKRMIVAKSPLRSKPFNERYGLFTAVDFRFAVIAISNCTYLPSVKFAPKRTPTYHQRAQMFDYHVIAIRVVLPSGRCVEKMRRKDESC